MLEQDRVVLKLKGEELRIVESYDVQMAVMTQPSRFTVRLGHGGTVKELLRRYPPGSPFELFVRPREKASDLPQFSGFLTRRGASGQNATVLFGGMDGLQRLHLAEAKADKSFAGRTYFQLVEDVLNDAGVPDWTLFEGSTNEASLRTGTKLKNRVSFRETGFKTRVKKAVVHPPLIRAGERYFAFLKRYLDRAGLFLYAIADTVFVLMAPNPDQAPLYRIVNRRGAPRADEPGNVLEMNFDDDVTERPSEIVVYGRNGGRRAGRGKSQGQYLDDEMTDLGIFRSVTVIDASVSSPAEAAFFARRNMAEARRAGWALSYTVAGHTTPALDGSRHLAWSIDTMVDLDDEELGLSGPHYIESVTFSSDGEKSTTTLRVMRPGDLVFGHEEGGVDDASG